MVVGSGWAFRIWDLSYELPPEAIRAQYDCCYYLLLLKYRWIHLQYDLLGGKTRRAGAC